MPLSAYGEAEARAAAEMLAGIRMDRVSPFSAKSLLRDTLASPRLPSSYLSKCGCADEKLDMVFASPLSRAVYGAERVAEKHALKVTLDDRFKEVQRGRWLGKTRDQINDEFPGDLENFAKDPTWKGHGGETYCELSARVLTGLETMLAAARESKATKIALVSHMWVTKSIVTDAMGILPDEQDKWEEVSIPTASISVLDFPREQGSIPADLVSVGVKPPILEADALDPSGKPWGG